MLDPKMNIIFKYPDNCYSISQGQSMPKELLSGIAQGHIIQQPQEKLSTRQGMLLLGVLLNS